MKRVMVFLALIIAVAMPSQAQRLIPNQKGLELFGGVPIVRAEKLFRAENYTAGVSLVRYFKTANYAFLALECEGQTYDYRSSDVAVLGGLLQVGYMHPILSDGGKNIFFYLGATGLGGYEEVNGGKADLPDGAILLDKSRLVYGGALQASVELFLTDSWLFVVKGQGRMLFGSNLNAFRPNVTIGLRVNL
ncbi:conjugal transfer protein TraO [Porphyromonadaceae bacterium W3.11]|nr:conjugal transfer protein TraO [Porphyromonadaceae bacterium W3.11]